jgi:cysteine desulfurase
MERIYLDYAATTPTDPAVLEAMKPYFFEKFGNPSSIHFFGQEAKKAMEEARSKVANFLGAKEEEIVFTSGGTEADNFALFGVVWANAAKGNHIVTTAIEHHAILEPAHFLEKQGYRVTYVKPDQYGVVAVDEIAKALTDKTVLISVMHANNEIGTIQPIREIGAIAKGKGIYFHTDAVQTVGHIPVNVNDLNVDLLSLSAHKFYGPKGIGCLYIRKGTRIQPFLRGGGQERRRRASTENVVGIVGLGWAIDLCCEKMDGEAKVQIRLRDRLIAEIQKRIDRVYLNGHPTQRLPNNVNLSIEYIEGESMLLNLDILGIGASTGSACTSGDLEPSHVLLSIGRPHELCHGSIRLTLGRYSKESDVDRFLEVFPNIVSKLRAMSPLSMTKNPKKIRKQAAPVVVLIFSSALCAYGSTTESLEPIVVEKALYGSASGGSVTSVLTREDIKKIPAGSPEELLPYLGANIQTRGSYGIKSDITLNGSTFQQVLILVNGVRVKDPQTAHQDLDLFFNVEDIERIEIIPAAASAIYGPDGIAGAINFVLKKPDQAKSSFSASVGNHETFEQDLNLSYGFKRLRNRLTISHAQSNGSRYDTGYRNTTFFHSLAFEGDDAALYFDAGYNEKKFGAYDFYTPGKGYPSKEWINTKFFDLRGVLKNENFTFEPKFNFRQRFDKFMLTILKPNLYLNHHETDVYEAGGRLTFPFERGSFAIGGDFSEEQIVSNNLGKHTRDRWDFYLNPRLDLNEATLVDLAARVDDYSTFEAQATGSITLKHKFDEKMTVM